jgi:hypothetical protein
MGYPLTDGSDGYHTYTYYQGVMAGELLAMTGLFYFIQTMHYWIWGH